MPERFEALVVGGGVVGLLAALELSRRGLSTGLLEAVRLGYGASTRNAGVLHVIQPPPGRLRRALAREGLRRYTRLLDKLGIGFHRTRLIMPAFTARESLLTPAVALGLRLVAPHAKIEIAGGEEARRLEPALARGVRRAIVVEGYITLRPEDLVESLRELAEHRGVSIVEGLKVERVSCNTDGFEAEQEGSIVKSRILINAAGSGATSLARHLGLYVETRLVPGVMTLHPNTLGLESILARFPRIGVKFETKGGAAIPWPQGEILLGPTFEKQGIPAGSPDAGRVARRYKHLFQNPLPEPKRIIVGERVVARGRDFVLSPSPRCRGDAHALGIESPGLTAAPAIAEKLVSIALSRRP